MALTSTTFTDLEVLQRKLQRLLWLCRTLEHSETFQQLSRASGHDPAAVHEVSLTCSHTLALVNASPTLLSAEEQGRQTHWVNAHLLAFDDLLKVIRYFDSPPTAQHLA